MAQPRILTFNFHEPYLWLMAKTGLQFDVGHYDQGLLARTWNEAFRPKPPNLRLLTEPEWRAAAAENRYDVIIAHNEMNAMDVITSKAAKLLVCHNRRSFLNTSASCDQGDPIDLFKELLERLVEHFAFIFISESKRDDYGIPGRIILPGIDVNEFGGYTGETPCIVRVGNVIRERNWMFDVPFQETVCHGLPNCLLGNNPGIPESKPAASFDDLLEHYRHNRCMLHVTRESFEDGYNLAMLEAMACGMPVVSLANWTSPLTDGVDGFVSYSAPQLRARLIELLENPALAREIGARGRETAAKIFPMEAFVTRWREAIFEAADNAPGARRIAPPPVKKRLNILLHYVASPLTTGRYMESALRARHRVVNAGFRLPEDVLRLWGFSEEAPPYPPQQIDLPHKAPYRQLLEGIPKGYDPDLYLWVDSGPSQIEPDIGLLPMPKIAYLIDTHVSPGLRLEMARHFDCVFLAQKAQVEPFRAAGIKNIFWMPLGCSPELHRLPPMPRIHDVAYVGSFSAEESDRRRLLLDAVARRFPNNKIGRFWPETMATIYAQSKIVINACHSNDVNMRVFEAMASGALLITDPAEGLEDLFTDGEHLVIYRNDAELPDLIARYLDDQEARERIARAGQNLTLRQHTYAHRMDVIIQQSTEILGIGKPGARHAPKPKDYYSQPRRDIMQYVPRRLRRVLDVGCGAGALGKALKDEYGVQEVAGIEIIPEAGARARNVLDHVLMGNIEELDLPFPPEHFDCIICGDVLEHLVDPAAALRKLARVLTPNGLIIISAPNVRYYEVLAMLVSGGWTYMDAGILDATHLRFFTRSALIEMIEEAGLQAAEVRPLNMQDPSRFPIRPDASLNFGKLTLNNVSNEEYLEFLVYQYVALVCKPGADRLAEAREALAQGENEAALALAAEAVAVDECSRLGIVAKAFARLGQLDKAERYYRDALQIRHEDQCAGELGILLVAMNRIAEARPLLQSALQAMPGNDAVRGAMGLVFLTEGRHEEAFTHFHAALQSGFELMTLLRPFLDTARSLGRLEEAEPILARFVDFYPGKLDIAVEHMALLHALGRVQEARSRADIILMLYPGHEETLALLEQINQDGNTPRNNS